MTCAGFCFLFFDGIQKTKTGKTRSVRFSGYKYVTTIPPNSYHASHHPWSVSTDSTPLQRQGQIMLNRFDNIGDSMSLCEKTLFVAVSTKVQRIFCVVCG